MSPNLYPLPALRDRRWKLGSDARLVLDAAAALDVTEFEFFTIAWRQWHGTAPDPTGMERAFAAYMFAGVIPPWVRHVAREVRRRHVDHRLVAADFGVVARPLPPHPLRWLFAAGVLLPVAVLIVGLIAGSPGPGEFSRLGCEAGPGWAYITETARQFTGEPDPFGCER